MMFHAVLWGTIAASATMIGAIVSLYFSLSKRWIGTIMALGAGALIGATSYELLEESLEFSGFLEIAVGFFGGAILFTGLDAFVAKQGGQRSKRIRVIDDSELTEDVKKGSGFRMFIGTVLDTLPETAMIGMSLARGDTVSVALVVSIFISNFPEGFSSTNSLKKLGYGKKLIIILWIAVVVFSAGSAAIGFLLIDAPNSIKAIVSAFAGGAIIAMLSTAMMPEAYKQAGSSVGLITTMGLFIALYLHRM